MALSQMDQEYTHKKFNYSCLHKKSRQNEHENNENINETPLDKEKYCKTSRNLFRPYALDENNTPRKRKTSTSSVKSLEDHGKSPEINKLPDEEQQLLQQQLLTPLNIITTISCPTATTTTTTYSTDDFPAFSPNSYHIRLQRQRNVLYTRYLAQIYQQSALASMQNVTGYPMGYPNITAPIFNWC